MKPYLESLRRFGRIGLGMLILTAIASVAVAMQICTIDGYRSLPGIEEMFTPLMVYAYVAGVVFAFTGFSFLNRRAESDFYHSVPVSRKNMFLSVTFAALTWIAATVLVCVILTTSIFLIARVAFVPLYPLVAVPFYIVTAMLVFAAAAIACSLTGTFLTDTALTLIVLFLPRFIQFVVARGMVAEAKIIGWLDLPWYLNPCWNIATGQIVELVRHMFQNEIFGVPYLIYSAVLACAELAAACLLFQRRPSETAESGTRSGKLQTLYACLLTLPIVLLFASGAVKPNLKSILIVLAVSLACYTIYQAVMLRNGKKVLRSLPWYLVPAALAVCLFFGVQQAGEETFTYVPSYNEIAYVQFEGSDRGEETVGYDSIVVSDICFDSTELKAFVLDTLYDNIANIDENGYYNYDYDPQTTYNVTTEPVTIVLNSGRKIGRVLTFLDGNRLNALRDENEEYVEAIRTLPPTESVRYRQGYDAFDEEYVESDDLFRTYYEEVESTGLIPYSQYRQQSADPGYEINEKQSFGSLALYGYVGMTRYSNNFDILLETPKAASAWMAMKNRNSSDESLDLLRQVFDATLTLENEKDSMDMNITFYNVPSNVGKQMRYLYYYISGYSSNNMDERYIPLVDELIDIFNRSTPTDDPNSLCVYMQWDGRALDADGNYIGADKMLATDGNIVYASNGNVMCISKDYRIYSYNPQYRSFSEADEARILEIIEQWTQIQEDQYASDLASYSSSDTAAADETDDSVYEPVPTPTPVPAP